MHLYNPLHTTHTNQTLTSQTNIVHNHVFMQPPPNPLCQRQDFQNRRSASEPVHDPQSINRSIDIPHTNPPNSAPIIGTNTAIHTNQTCDTPRTGISSVNVNDGFADCLQKIATIKVRQHKSNTKNTKNVFVFFYPFS